jgi:prepilin-type N-terminal cleavage/methylation domain-containing protein
MKRRRGFTLLEMIIALTLWLILSAGIFLVWQYSTHSATEMRLRQSAFENARIVMDALIMNIQMSRKITLQTNNNDLYRLTLNQLNNNNWEDFNFGFRADGARLMFGTQEFATNIASIKIIPVEDTEMNIMRMQITVTTACDEPIILEGSVDTRYKCVSVNGTRRCLHGSSQNCFDF